MKLKSIVIIALILSMTLCSCFSTEITKTDLTENDYVYIDLVYSNLTKWEHKIYDSGEKHTINKIAFYDFDGTGKLCFYKNYPVAAGSGVGYFIYEDKMVGMDFSVYDYDENTRHRGWLARTTIDGIDWNVKATDEEKYQKLEEAYLKYLNNEN